MTDTIDIPPVDDEVLENLGPAAKAELLDLLELREKYKIRDKARASFMAYCEEMWPQFIGGAHHEIMADAFERIIKGDLKRLIISMPPRHAFAVDTLVPTTEGFKRIDEIKVGDYLYGIDGKPTMCEAVSETYEQEEAWRVTTNDGASVVTDAAHCWNVALDRKRPVFKNKTTMELWRRQQKGARPPRLPNYEAIDCPERDFLVDPYVLGVWLGDGHSKQAIIIKNDEDAAHIRARFEQKGFHTTDQATPMTFGIPDLKVRLRDLGVLGNKHIPEEYLFGSVKQRRELLYGLMDTDGNVTKQGQCFYNTSSKVLRDQSLSLLASLGVKASVATCRAVFEGRDYGESYRISFYDPDPCTLPRKRVRARDYMRPVHRNIRLERVGKCNTRCVKIDRDDGLFLVTERFIACHNTKSEFGSWLLPSWFFGHFPDKKVLHASHTQDLTANFGRKVRDLIDEQRYRDIFPETILKADAKSSGKWQTTKGGQYYAAGVGGALAGRGADLAIIDDPISEQDLTDGAFDQCWEWFMAGPRQRLQPGGAIVIIMTRWSKKDLVGRLLAKMRKDPLAEQYEYIEFPGLIYEDGYEGEDDHILDSLWPEYWPKDAMLSVKNSIAKHLWDAQYMQKPTGKGSSIISKGQIERWPADRPIPPPEFKLHSYDTAFDEKEQHDPTGFTEWIAFRPQGRINDKWYDGTRLHFMATKALKKRMEFPDLKRFALRLKREEQPDSVLIEKRATGLPMAQELFRAGINVELFTPTRGTGDKTVRLNAVVTMFENGLVWVPEGPSWADDLVEDLCDFPNAEDDDLVDSTSMALSRFKRGNLVSLKEDEFDDEHDRLPRRPRKYYNV